MKFKERRRRRSDNTTQALRLQLDACRQAARLQGMVLSDEDGVCLAAAGDSSACDEIAARLPLVARKVRDFEGVLLGGDHGWEVRMRRFHVAGSELYMCAIGGRAEQRDRQILRSVTGVSRILETPALAS